MEKITFVDISTQPEKVVKEFNFEDDTAVCMLGLMLNAGTNIDNHVTIDNQTYRVRGSKANMDTGDVTVKVLPIYGG